ncbi:hypothetical protein GCM10022243_46410 [Saccharothrix violaceirubra]|uniref:Uncharacterized protein n=1 Tax=Saccharothrix violaceirubra TaxID=413306 RepID=A0A7W7T344_9PSEU|nr:hypothetical protein [Saccharothrix violaceirubra]MBB4964470.1 hypothetical protein [Saccharothrix violaceirubra]
MVVASALVTFFALVAVLTPTPVDARVVAARTLEAAKGSPTTGAIADDVAPRLPEGARAVVVKPGGTGERAGTGEVAVLVGDVDRSAASLLLSGGVVATQQSDDGWWVAVSVPDPRSPPLGAVLALLTGAVVLGAAATELHRPKRRDDLLVRGLANLLPDLPAHAAWRARGLLIAGGVRPVHPDEHRHVVGTVPTDDEALVGTVARTVRPGYADGDRVLVRPAVFVYVKTDDQGCPLRHTFPAQGRVLRRGNGPSGPS